MGLVWMFSLCWTKSSYNTFYKQLFFHKVRELTQGLGVSDENQLFTMLQFYHDLGTIIYFGDKDNSNSYLQDMVILDPQWLIDIFKRIITVMPHQKQVYDVHKFYIW